MSTNSLALLLSSALALLTAGAIDPVALHAQEVELIIGSGYRPLTLAEGQIVSHGTSLVADGQTIIVLIRSWPISSSHGCAHVVVIRGARYETDSNTPKHCDASRGGEEHVLRAALSADAIVAHHTATFLLTTEKADKADITDLGEAFAEDLARLKEPPAS